jgi:hypothetical protein
MLKSFENCTFINSCSILFVNKTFTYAMGKKLRNELFMYLVYLKVGLIQNVGWRMLDIERRKTYSMLRRLENESRKK